MRSSSLDQQWCSVLWKLDKTEEGRVSVPLANRLEAAAAALLFKFDPTRLRETLEWN